MRCRIDTVFGQRVGRCDVGRIGARDRWHLGNRVLREVLPHTPAVPLHVELGNLPLHLARLAARQYVRIGLHR